MSADDQIEELKRIIEEERRQRLASRRLAETRYRARMKEDRELKERTDNVRRKYRSKPEVKKRMVVSDMKYVRAKRVRLAGRPKPETCDVCNRSGRIVFDHCHNSKKFRGWICHNCNVILGLADDNIVFLEKLIVYLKAAESGQDE